MRNKAEYIATPVACGCAGAVKELTKAFGQKQWAQKAKKSQKNLKGTYKLTNQPTNQPTDGPTVRLSKV